MMIDDEHGRSGKPLHSMQIQLGIRKHDTKIVYCGVCFLWMMPAWDYLSVVKQGQKIPIGFVWNDYRSLPVEPSPPNPSTSLVIENVT